MKIHKACEKANHVCDKSQYNEATFLEKLKLMLHLLFCSACRKYSNNNKKLTATLENSKVDCMHKKEKEALKENLEKAIHKQQH
ncbi:hypothetical protein Q4509_07260 [Oceanihabitans sp. 1_MG-2023]|uniref:hypothetical protein n=1 Tax=Flavobacteriaceae TaxID=49546 RepID=UPI002090C692|nr:MULTISPECIES: hypothetical protein [Flavobacteriaceae]MDO6622650.1 hypothetical protein [Oceanihabitans sp. 1_MG-2023]